MRGVVSVVRLDYENYVIMTFRDRKTGEKWKKIIPANDTERIRDLKKRFFNWVESRD